MGNILVSPKLETIAPIREAAVGQALILAGKSHIGSVAEITQLYFATQVEAVFVDGDKNLYNTMKANKYRQILAFKKSRLR